MFKNLKLKKNKSGYKKSISTEAYKISILYALFGGLWIILSDSLLLNWFSDLREYKYYQTFKGWIYILITTLWFFCLSEGA